MNESLANSKNEYGIPIAYKWKPDKKDKKEKFKSFNKPDSDPLDEVLMNYIDKGFGVKLAGTNFDSLVLLNSETKVKKV